MLKSDAKARPSGSSENFAVTCPSLGSHANVQPTMVPMPMSSQCRDQRCRQKGGNLGKRILFVATGLIGSCINQFCDVNPKSVLKNSLLHFLGLSISRRPAAPIGQKPILEFMQDRQLGDCINPYNILMVENRGTHVCYR